MDAISAKTEAPVTSKPEWTDVRFGNNYRLTVRVIGRDIVYTRPSGSVSLPELEPALDLITRIVDETIGRRRPHVQIADYSSLKSTSAEARRAYIRFMASRPNLVGAVFFGASPTLKMSIKLGRRLHFVKGNIALVNNFDEAIEQARRMLRHPRSDTGGDRPSQGSRRPDRAAVPDEGWIYRHRGFELTWELIDDHVMHGAAAGTLRSEHIDSVFELSDRVVQVARSGGDQPALVINIDGLDGVSVAGRRRFVNTLSEWQKKNTTSLFALYGANSMLKGAIAISRPFLPFPLTLTRDLSSALKLVPESLPVHRRRVPKSRGAGLKPVPTPTAGERHIDDVLRFLGNINWEKDGMEWWDDEVGADHPLSPVFDAIALLKSDVDHLLRERRRAEEALRESTERYRTILENIADGYYEIDLDGHLTFCNDAMLDIIGHARDALPDLDPQVFMEPHNASRIMAAFKRVYNTGRPTKVLDWELVRSDRRKISVEASISIIQDSKGEPVGFRGIVRDVSERAAAAREQQRLEAQLRQAQRMEAVGTLAGGIAHNFNNLLMGIQGNVSLVRKDTDPRHPHHQRLTTIQSLVTSGSKLTRELLGFARAGRYEVRPIDINQLVREAAETFATTRREIRVHLNLTDRLLRAKADRGQLDQVLLNLFINSAEAMPSGGELFLESGITYHTALEGRQYRPKPGRYIWISIRDTGVGMDEATQRRIFEPFYTTKGLSGGTGLGLASVYGSIKAHGGYVDVASELGMGSTFTLYLPATEEEVFAAEDTKGEIILGKGTVLIVDDDEAVLEACASILSYLEYTPIRVATGRQAVEVFRDRSTEIDLVVLDMILPDIGGGEVYDSLRAIDPEVKVLLASGYSLDGAAQSILKKGCDDFIQKPFTIGQLSKKMGTILGTGDPATVD